MKKKKIVFESLKIDPMIFFTGSDAEIEAAERMQEERQNEIKMLLENENFMSLSFQTFNGLWEAITPATRPGEKWQHTFFYKANPNYHESTTDERSEKEMLWSIAGKSFYKNLHITLFTA